MSKLKNIVPYIVIAILFVLLVFQNKQTLNIKDRLKELNQQNDSLALDIKAKQTQILELNSIAEKFKEEIEKDKAELEVLKEKSKQNKNKHDKERDRINNLDAKSVVSEFTDAFK